MNERQKKKRRKVDEKKRKKKKREKKKGNLLKGEEDLEGEKRRWARKAAVGLQVGW